MACKYVNRFTYPKSAGFTGSAKKPNGMASGGRVTKQDVQLVNQVLTQAQRTGRLPGVK